METWQLLVIAYLAMGWLIAFEDVRKCSERDYYLADFLTTRTSHFWAVMLFWPVMVLFALGTYLFKVLDLFTVAPVVWARKWQIKRAARKALQDEGFYSSRDWV